MNSLIEQSNTALSDMLGPDLDIGFVGACWHKDIVDQARRGFTAQMSEYGLNVDRIVQREVAGAFEIPLLVKRMAVSGRYAAIVTCALVVDGGIYRHDFVASTVVDALMQIQLETMVPVMSAVLTPHHFHDHAEHQRYYFNHFEKKGAEAANAVVSALLAHQKESFVR